MAYSFDGRQKSQVVAVQPTTTSKIKWSRLEVREFLRSEVRGLHYTVRHAQHIVTKQGPAPNETQSNRIAEKGMQEKAVF